MTHGGNVRYSLDKGIQTVEYNGLSYIVHPAFTDDSQMTKEYKAYSHGGWNSELEGIWIAKYEMSMEKNGQNFKADNGGNIPISEDIKVVSKPFNHNWNYIKPENCYYNSYNYDRTKESHLMKNSEYGAVAFLAHSKYGRNGNKITNNDTYICGEGGNLSSTTGNIYGIFDLAGGGYEYLAGYNVLGSYEKLKENGASFTVDENGNIIKEDTKYANVYSNLSNDIYDGENIYNVNKIGEASKEVYSKEENSAWFGNTMRYVYYDGVFLARGGQYGMESKGTFTQTSFYGMDTDYTCYRVVLCI